MYRTLALLLVVLFTGCSTGPERKTLILKYSDFGPQVIAHEVIGMDWWQWQVHGDSRPRDYDINVVVYRQVELDEVKSEFPVKAETETDYRYLEYATALEFLNKYIDKNIVEQVTERLKETRKQLVEKLGD